jgi:hypothetical protein
MTDKDAAEDDFLFTTEGELVLRSYNSCSNTPEVRFQVGEEL